MRNKVFTYVGVVFFTILSLIGFYLHDYPGALWTGSVAIFGLSNHINIAKNRRITIAELALVGVSCVVVLLANRDFQFGLKIETLALILLALQIIWACIKLVLKRRHTHEEAE